MIVPAAIQGRKESVDIEGLIREGRHRDAVAALAREHGGTLGRLCMALLASQSEAEEAVQETLLAAYRGMAGYRFEGTLKAWLYAIARRQCARRLERRQKRTELSLVPEPDDGPASELSARQRAQRVRAALARIKPSEREAVVLRYLSQLDYSEIAAALDIAESAARKRVSRGLAALRGVLGGEDLL
jgi:RNA polymerase sigma-70 factor (ECF subfamily)